MIAYFIIIPVHAAPVIIVTPVSHIIFIPIISRAGCSAGYFVHSVCKNNHIISSHNMSKGGKRQLQGYTHHI